MTEDRLKEIEQLSTMGGVPHPWITELIAEVRRLQSVLAEEMRVGNHLDKFSLQLIRERDEARVEVARLTAKLIDYDAGWRE